MTADNYDTSPESCARCVDLFERLPRDAVALVNGGTIGDAHPFLGINNAPLAAKKNRRERKLKDCKEGGPSKKNQRGAAGAIGEG